MYEKRTYRNEVSEKDLVKFEVIVKETDLFIRADKDLTKETKDLIVRYRRELEEYIAKDPAFLTALKPYKIKKEAPDIIKDMAEAGRLAGVGPMASVAGTIAEYAAKGLLAYSKQVIVENGGDIFLKVKKRRQVGIYAGKDSAYRDKVTLEIKPEDTPLGISTSSGTFGHSLSFGKADAAVVISRSGALADSCATKLGNLIKSPSDIPKAIDVVKVIPGVRGILIIAGKEMGLWGEVKLVKI